MAGTILTPTLVWKNFSVEKDFNEKVVAGTNDGDFSIKQIYFNGRPIKKERVEIFATLIKSELKPVKGGILFVGDLGTSIDTTLLKTLAERGFLVLAVDLCGKDEQALYYTRYPESISYANYVDVKDKLYSVEGDANKTCWYEWACVLRYSLSYLKAVCEIKKVGGFAVGESATALWQVAGMDKELDCAVFALNAGWAGYRGIDKFGGVAEPQFSDNMYKFIAGIEPQAYAMHVECPTLVLTPTNSNYYDCDRAYDTLTYIKPEVYSTINYSVGYINSVDESAINTAFIFLDNFLGKDKKDLPADIDIRSECVDGNIKFFVSGELTGAKEIFVFVCEETVKASLRAWRKLSEKQVEENGEVSFTYSPYTGSETVIAFAAAVYKNGYSIGSKVISKKFNSNEVALSYKSNVIYSSRNSDAESVFIAADQDGQGKANLNTYKNGIVEVKKGPMGINGAHSSKGLLTFKINAKTDRPQERAMLMFDIYSKEAGAMAVKLIADYFGEKTEYFAWVTVMGGEVWQNVKIELSRFKTEQGMALKDFSKINAMEFVQTDKEFLVNNALWV